MFPMTFIEKIYNCDTRYINFRFYIFGIVSLIIAPALLSYLGSIYYNLYINTFLWFILYFIIPYWFMSWFDLNFLPCLCSRKVFNKYKFYIFKCNFFQKNTF